MDSFDRGCRDRDEAGRAEHGVSRETAALWSALEADHRARDERTDRLRAMRLCQGDDETA